jgi:hypothetical protein
MKRNRNIFCATVVVCALGLCAAAFAADNFVGSWKLNLEKSTYDPGPPPRSLMVTIQAVGDTLNFMFDGYDGEGKALLFEELSITLDGKEYPIKDDPNRDTTSMKKIDDYTIEQTNTKNGKVATVVRTVYNRDGKSRTMTTTGTDTQGRPIHNVAFFDRVK